MTAPAGEFAAAGYRVVENLLPAPVRAFVYEYVTKAARDGRLDPGDDDVPNTPFRYADPFFESLLKLLLPIIEEETGIPLYPTYSYVRVYKRGDVLRAHRDRPSCEISATVSLGYEAAHPWPIWIETGGTPAAFELPPGAALLYRGIDLPHWRDRFDGVHAAQAFFHYVARDGAYADWKFDRRAALGTSVAAERIVSALMQRSIIATP
jgi:hypothetical protein